MGQSKRRRLIDLTEKMVKPDRSKFYLKLLSDEQKQAWEAFQNNDILFFTGPAGTGKSHISIAFALHEILEKNKEKIVLSRPVIEAGESLGYLPGDISEKLHPYMLPFYDILDKMCGKDSEDTRRYINSRIEIAPLAYLRGRAQPLDATIMTPSGPRKMGDLVIGDYVIGSSGKPVAVTGIYPQGEKDVYRVKFTDRSYTECCDDHLWSTQTLSEKRHDKGFSVKSLKNIRQKIKSKWNQKIHRIPILSSPIEFSPKEVSIDPYLLGLLLGDGCLQDHAGISFSTADEELAESIRSLLPEELKLAKKKNHLYDYGISGDQHKRNPLKTSLREINLLGKKSHNKFIPDEYKYNTIEIRTAILRGLMDTDGTISATKTGGCRIQYSTTSHQLAQDILFIVESLGGIAYVRKREYDNTDDHELSGHIVRHVHSCYVLDIVIPNLNPFKLSRKAELYVSGMKPVRLIESIELIGHKQCQCIKVDSPDHLYLTDHCIVTHNTLDNAICILDEAQNCTSVQLKLFLTRLGNNSKMIITGDPTQSDLCKTTPEVFNTINKISGIPGVCVVPFTEQSIVRHPIIKEILKMI